MYFRTFLVTIKDQQLFIPTYIRRVRPLNKELMFTIGTSSFTVARQSALYIVHKRRKERLEYRKDRRHFRAIYSIIYLGFNFRYHVKRKLKYPIKDIKKRLRPKFRNFKLERYTTGEQLKASYARLLKGNNKLLSRNRRRICKHIIRRFLSRNTQYARYIRQLYYSRK